MSQTADQAILSRLPLDTQASFHAHKFVETAIDVPESTVLQTVKMDSSGESKPLDSESGCPPGVTPALETGFGLRGVIGQGGHGEVWEADQPSLGRRVAVKKIRRDIYEKYAGEPARIRWFETNFRLEAIATARLEHPNIVPVHAFEEDADGRLLLAMKLVKGRSWHEMLDADFESLSVADYLAKHLPILVDVAQAVAFAHAQGIVHRDLKPSQVMIGEFGEVALMDWGIAVAVGDGATRATPSPSFTQGLPTPATASSPGGTLAFMAPEQTEQSAIRVGTWTDVYLLGGMLYMILTGQPPHPGETREQAYFQACTGTVPAPASLSPDRDIPQELSEIAMRALRPVPRDRYTTAAEFLNELNDFMTGATKRRAAAALVSEVRSSLTKKPRDYSEITELLAKLDQARMLWPENREVPLARTELLALQSELAIENGDLVLASATIGRLEDPASLATLRPKLERALAAQAAQKRQRRLGIAASFLLAILLAGGSFLAYRKASSDRDSIRQARGASEDLVRFMVTDLRQRLAPIDPDLKMLGPAADKAVAHYLAQNIEALYPDELAKLIGGLGDAASIQLKQGNSKAGLAALDARERILDQAEAMYPGDPEWVIARLKNALIYSGTHFMRGDAELAYEALRSAERKTDAYVKAHPEDTLVAQFRQSIRTEISQYYMLKGDYDAAVKELKASVEFWTKLQPTPEKANEKADVLGATYSRLGIVQSRLGQLEASEESFNLSLASYRMLLSGEATPRNKYLVAVALINLSDHERQLGQMAKCIAHLAETEAILSGLLSDHGTNAEYAAALHKVLPTLAEDALGRGEFAVAEDLLSRDLALIEPFLERDPENLVWQRARWLAFSSFADLEGARGNKAKALEYMKLALAETEAALIRTPRSEAIINDRLMQLTNSVNRMDVEIGEERALAREYIQEGIALSESTMDVAVDKLERMRGFGLSYAQLGRIELRSGEMDRAIDSLQRSVEFARAVEEQSPKSYRATRDVSASEFRLAGLFARSLKFKEATDQMNVAVAGFSQLASEYPEIIAAKTEAFTLRALLAEFEMMEGHLDSADENLASAWAGLEEVREAGGLNGEFLRSVHTSIPANRAFIRQLRGEYAEASEFEEAGLALATSLVADLPTDRSVIFELSRAKIIRGYGMLNRGNPEDALTMAQTSFSGVGADEITTRDAKESEEILALARANCLAALALRSLDRNGEAEVSAHRAATLAIQVLELQPGVISGGDLLDCLVTLKDCAPSELPRFVGRFENSGAGRADVVEILREQTPQP